MFSLGSIGFTAPWLLLGLIALPVLWLLLRAIPPAPIRRRFPGVALLLGLTDDEHQSDRTPWWLLLIRVLAVALVIAGFAGPILNPQVRTPGSGPLLVLTDATWASARDWPRRTDRIAAALAEAGRNGRTAAVVALTDLPAGGPVFQSADQAASRLTGLTPAASVADEDAIVDWAQDLDGPFETLWLSDGLEHPYRAELLAALQSHGAVRVFESPRPVYALRPAVFEDGQITLTVLRPIAGPDVDLTLAAIGPDPAGIERQLATVQARFTPGDTQAQVQLTLPPELRNRVARFEITGITSAGAVSLSGDSLRRSEVALIDGRAGREGLELLSQTHYLRQALTPTADLIEGGLAQVLPANPDAIILADVAEIAPPYAADLLEWVDGGGLLLRFAGPRLAASDLARMEEDPLLPVRLRAGGRTVGGAMSWGEARSLRAFAEGSPFYGLTVPADVTVSAQVLAQPDPDLPERVIATLSDGTPLVTRKRIGDGQVVLFHVTANAEWSTLPLSGLFVQMLERLAVAARPTQVSAEDLAGQTFAPDSLLTGFGQITDAGSMAAVSGADLAAAIATGTSAATLPAGLYAGEDRRIALNVLGSDSMLASARWPASVPVEGIEAARETPLKGWLLTAALGLLMLDVLATLALSGRLRRAGGTLAGVALALACAVATPAPVQAQSGPGVSDADAIRAASEVVLAFVKTGDPSVDTVSEAGLRGLSSTLFQRTSIEPAPPLGVDLETDELSFFPLLYWPVTADQTRPSDAAYVKLNAYLRGGGMIVFDTRDADIGGTSAAGRRLQSLAAPLDIPPLEPIPSDHVLTRTFYLLQDFPGRYNGGNVWVEAAPADAEQAEGMPFRNLNDNVTPVLIGGNDWAAAWAVDERGMAMFPVGRGFAGERQREIALRFGVNLVMHVLTGNYKSDQVHVPALLDRLGQ